MIHKKKLLYMVLLLQNTVYLKETKVDNEENRYDESILKNQELGEIEKEEQKQPLSKLLEAVGRTGDYKVIGEKEKVFYNFAAEWANKIKNSENVGYFFTLNDIKELKVPDFRIITKDEKCKQEIKRKISSSIFDLTSFFSLNILSKDNNKENYLKAADECQDLALAYNAIDSVGVFTIGSLKKSNVYSMNYLLPKELVGMTEKEQKLLSSTNIEKIIFNKLLKHRSLSEVYKPFKNKNLLLKILSDTNTLYEELKVQEGYIDFRQFSIKDFNKYVIEMENMKDPLANFNLFGTETANDIRQFANYKGTAGYFQNLLVLSNKATKEEIHKQSDLGTINLKAILTLIEEKKYHKKLDGPRVRDLVFGYMVEKEKIDFSSSEYKEFARRYKDSISKESIIMFDDQIKYILSCLFSHQFLDYSKLNNNNMQIALSKIGSKNMKFMKKQYDDWVSISDNLRILSEDDHSMESDSLELFTNLNKIITSEPHYLHQIASSKDIISEICGEGVRFYTFQLLYDAINRKKCNVIHKDDQKFPAFRDFYVHSNEGTFFNKGVFNPHEIMPFNSYPGTGKSLVFKSYVANWALYEVFGTTPFVKEITINKNDPYVFIPCIFANEGEILAKEGKAGLSNNETNSMIIELLTGFVKKQPNLKVVALCDELLSGGNENSARAIFNNIEIKELLSEARIAFMLIEHNRAVAEKIATGETLVFNTTLADIYDNNNKIDENKLKPNILEVSKDTFEAVELQIEEWRKNKSRLREYYQINCEKKLLTKISEKDYNKLKEKNSKLVYVLEYEKFNEINKNVVIEEHFDDEKSFKGTLYVTPKVVKFNVNGNEVIAIFAININQNEDGTIEFNADKTVKYLFTNNLKSENDGLKELKKNTNYYYPVCVNNKVVEEALNAIQNATSESRRKKYTQQFMD